MTPDTQTSTLAPLGEIVVYLDPYQLVGYLLLGLAFAAASCGFAIWRPSGPITGMVIGAIGVGFGLLCIGAIVPLLFRLKKPALVITPASISDLRVSSTPIPWTSVQSVDIWYQRGPRGVHLGVPEEFMQAYKTSSLRHWLHGVNRLFGYPGVWIPTAGSDIGTTELYQWCIAYWRASQAKDGSAHV